MDSIIVFFGTDPQQLMIYIGIALPFMFKFFGIDPLNWVKRTTGLEDNRANQLIIAVLMLFAFLALIVTGYFKNNPMVTLTQVIGMGSTCYTLSQITYNRIFKSGTKPPVDTGARPS